jgi:hypothetical protein
MSSPTYAPLALTIEMKELVNTALSSGNPMLLGVVGVENRPILTFRGSTQVYSDTQLGLWVRKTKGGTLESIKKNPNVAMMYRSATTPMLQFQGRARIATDSEERKWVFGNAPKLEQDADPERKGTAIIIDLEKVEGVLSFGPDGPVFCRMAKG